MPDPTPTTPAPPTRPVRLSNSISALGDALRDLEGVIAAGADRDTEIGGVGLDDVEVGPDYLVVCLADGRRLRLDASWDQG